MPTDTQLEAYWDWAIARWKAGETEHPLAHHPLAVKCDGFPGCFTVAPIQILPNHSKRYCADHLPQD